MSSSGSAFKFELKASKERLKYSRENMHFLLFSEYFKRRFKLNEAIPLFACPFNILMSLLSFVFIYKGFNIF